MARTIKEETETIVWAAKIIKASLEKITRAKKNCLKYPASPHPTNILTIEDAKCYGRLHNAISEFAISPLDDAFIGRETIDEYNKERARLFKLKDAGDQLAEHQRKENSRVRFTNTATGEEIDPITKQPIKKENQGERCSPVTVPFGKYKDMSVDVLLEDRNYCLFLNEKDWYREKYDYLYDLTKNIEDEPNE